jgi:hypothetical protein
MGPKATLTILHSITTLKATLTEVLVALLVVPTNSIMVLVGQGDRASLTTVHLAALVVQAVHLADQTNSTMVLVVHKGHLTMLLLQTILNKEELAGLTGKHYVLLAGFGGIMILFCQNPDFSHLKHIFPPQVGFNSFLNTCIEYFYVYL